MGRIAYSKHTGEPYEHLLSDVRIPVLKVDTNSGKELAPYGHVLGFEGIHQRLQVLGTG